MTGNIHTGNGKRHIIIGEEAADKLAENGFGSLCRLSSHRFSRSPFFLFFFFFFKYTVSCFPISDGRVWIKKLQPISQSRTIFGCTTDPLMWGFEFDRVLRCTHRCTQLSKFNYNQTMLVLVVGQSILTIYVTFIYLDYHTIYMCIYIYMS